MKRWVTEIEAIDPIDGELKRWGGPNITASSLEEAEGYCQKNYLGYCRVTGQLIEEIPDITGLFKFGFQEN